MLTVSAVKDHVAKDLAQQACGEPTALGLGGHWSRTHIECRASKC